MEVTTSVEASEVASAMLYDNDFAMEILEALATYGGRFWGGLIGQADACTAYEKVPAFLRNLADALEKVDA